MKLGIDYGTTTTLVSMRTESTSKMTSRIIDIGGNKKGYERSSIPSILAIRKDGGFAVGYEAEKIKEENPGQVVVLRSLKRCLSCDRKGEDAGDNCWNPMNRPFCRGDHKLRIFNHDRSIHELVGLFIDEILKQRAIKPIYSDASLKTIGVAVPAIFGAAPRRTIYSLMIQKVKDPIKIEVVNEPTAALLACKNETANDEDGVYAIIDVGGGTTDIIVYEKREENRFLFKPSGLRVAGDDVDCELMNKLFAKELTKSGEPDLILKEVRRAKERLTVLQQVTVLGRTISKGEFEEIAHPVLNKIVCALAGEIKAVFDLYKPYSQTRKEFRLRRIYLSGGGSKVPMLKDLINNNPYIQTLEPEVDFLRSKELQRIYGDDLLPIVLVALGASVPKSEFADTIQYMLPYSICLMVGDRKAVTIPLYEELPVTFNFYAAGEGGVQILAVDPNMPDAPVHNLTDELVANDKLETALSDFVSRAGRFEVMIDKFNFLRVSKTPPHRKIRCFALPWQGGIETALFEKHRKEWRRRHNLN